VAAAAALRREPPAGLDLDLDWPSSQPLNTNPWGMAGLPTMTIGSAANPKELGLSMSASEASPALREGCDEPDGGDGPVKFAMLVPTTTKGLEGVSIDSLPLVRTFLPTFKETVKPSLPRVEFHLYLGYDAGDAFYDTPGNPEAVRGRIAQMNTGLLPANVHFVRFPEREPLAILWNKLYDQAYAEGMHYFYQVGDDVKHKATGWADAFIDTLRNNPVARNFGVVGPSDCQLSVPWVEQAVVSRLHKRIHGDLFDPIFSDTSCDVWLSQAYGQASSYYLTDVQVYNSIRATRYKARPGTGHVEGKVRESRNRACAWLKKCSPNAPVACETMRTDSITVAFRQLYSSNSFSNLIARHYTLVDATGRHSRAEDIAKSSVCAKRVVSATVERILA